MSKYYKRLEDGAMDEIDAAIFNGDIFHNRENIKAFRDMMARWERGLQSFERAIFDEEQYLKSCPTCGAEDSGTSCGIPDCGWITGDQE